MSVETRSLTDKDYREIGRRYGSAAVGLEAREAAARWARHVDALAPFGYGESALREFQTLVSAHSEYLASHPKVVLSERESCREVDAIRSKAWAWVDMVSSVIGRLAQTDPHVAQALAAALPADDAQLEPRLGALCGLAVELKGRLPADAAIEARIAEAASLRAALTGPRPDAPTTTGTDAPELELLGGKIYVAIRNLNSAARRAIRNGMLRSQQSEYRFHHLNRSGWPGGPAPELVAETNPDLDLRF